MTHLHIWSFFACDACGKLYESSSKVSLFRWENCRFDLDISCALSTLSDRRDSQEGTTPEQINLLRHPHPLTSFSWKHDFVGDSDCMLCLERVEGDGYMCLRSRCEFLIQKRCIQDLSRPSIGNIVDQSFERRLWASCLSLEICIQLIAHRTYWSGWWKENKGNLDFMYVLQFLEVAPELGSNYNEVIASQDVATYRGLCALASFDRTELKAHTDF